MTAGGFSVSSPLSGMASEMRSASDELETLAGSAPSAPDAGAATGAVADILGTLLGAAGNLAMDAREAADRLDDSARAYAEVDERVALNLPTYE